MNKSLHRFSLIALLLLVSLVFGISAASPADAARITSFATSLGSVDRNALAARSARVPVSWTTQNRPIFANLFFEQVLPDGGVINVELPRLIPWVNSNGDGMAAPILPSESATEITLRVRLVSLLNGQILDEKTLRLPVGISGGNSGQSGARPVITGFSACCATVNAAALQARSALVPVTWSATNRPLTATLIFEQVLADGSVVNVELPRQNPWVNSSGNGVTAPVPPGGDSKDVNLRLRLIDLLTGRVYDQRTVRLTVTDANPQPGRISSFTTPVVAMTVTDLMQRTAWAPVTWSVDNRPDGSNLFFEQILPNGQVVNVELPRQNPYVSSQGEGIVAPVLPANSDRITLRLRLARLSDNATIDQRQITIAISGRYDETVTPTPTPSPVTEIFQFTASANTVFPGQQVQLQWDVRHASHVTVRAALTGPNARDAVAENLPLVSSTTLTIPDSIPVNTVGKLIIEAYTESNIPAATRELPLTVACRHDFFFDNTDDCRLADPVGADAAYQTFEGGVMVWRSDTRQVYGLLNNGLAFLITETFDGSQNTWGGDIPEGRYLPQNGFGQVWASNDGVRTGFGWGTTEERGYAGTFQRGANGNLNTTYYNTPDGRIVRFVNNGASYSWSYVG